MTQAPPDHEQRERAERHTDQPQLDGNVGPFGDVAQQKCNADEQHQQTDARHRVAAKKP